MQIVVHLNETASLSTDTRNKIDQQTVVDKGATIGANMTVSRFAFLGKVDAHDNVFVGEKAIVEDGTFLPNNTNIQAMEVAIRAPTTLDLITFVRGQSEYIDKE